MSVSLKYLACDSRYKDKLMDWLLYHVEGGSNKALGEGLQEASWQQAGGGDITGSVLIYLP